MFVRLEAHDEVVCETVFSEKVDIKLTYDVDIDLYSVIWKRVSGEYQLMWRGNFEGCIKEFRDIVGDLHVTYRQELNEQCTRCGIRREIHFDKHFDEPLGHEFEGKQAPMTV